MQLTAFNCFNFCTNLSTYVGLLFKVIKLILKSNNVIKSQEIFNGLSDSFN